MFAQVSLVLENSKTRKDHKGEQVASVDEELHIQANHNQFEQTNKSLTACDRGELIQYRLSRACML